MFAALFLLAMSVPPLMASAWLLFGSGAVQAQDADVTVHGCIERDAASRSPIYKLAESPGTRVFRLTAGKDIDVPSHVGHTVDITGTVGDAGRQSREPELIVKKLTDVRDSCTSASAR